MADLSVSPGQPAHAVALDAPTPASSQNHHFPAEVVSQIISCVVADGLTISNGSLVEVNFDTVRSLLKTNRETRSETLQQISRRPMHIILTGEKICDCDLKVHKSNASCNFFLQKLLNIPLRKWTGLVIHFRPLSAQESLETGPTEPPNPDAGSVESILAVRTNFLSAVEVTKHYAQRLSIALSFIEEETAQHAYCDPLNEIMLLGYHAYEQDLIDGDAGRRWRAPDTIIEPRRVNFTFDSPSEDVVPDGELNLPLWSMKMIYQLLEPWVWNVRKQGLENQIKLPLSVGASITLYPGQPRVFLSDASDVRIPEKFAKAFEGALRTFWQRSLSPAVGYQDMFVISHLLERDATERWYLDPRPREISTTWCRTGAIPVFRVTTSAGLPLKDDIWGPPFWKGAYLLVNPGDKVAKTCKHGRRTPYPTTENGDCLAAQTRARRY